MSNKISTVRTNIENALNELVASEDLKAIKRGAINPIKEPSLPVLGIAIGDFRREGNSWQANIELRIAVKSPDGTSTAAIDLAALADAKIQELIDSGSGGGLINQPRWDCWHRASGNKNAIIAVVAHINITVEAPLTS